jgi:hypothetical protein
MYAAYEDLDYLLVPTYFPLFVLLIRAEGIVLMYEVARGLVLSTQISNAILAALVYLDSIIISTKKSFDMYVGGVLPVALALVTNSVLVREYTSTEHNGVFALQEISLMHNNMELWYVAVDALWGTSCLIALNIGLLRGHNMPYAHIIAVMASSCFVLHVVVLDGYFSTSMYMLMCRIVCFYVMALFLYSIRVQRQMNATAHRYCTLHISLPVLFMHTYLLFGYIPAVVAFTLHSNRPLVAYRDSSKRQDICDVREVCNSTRAIPNNAQCAKEIEDVRQTSLSENDDSNILLRELQEAKQHFKTASSLGFV